MDVAIKNKRVGTDLTDGSVFRTLILFSVPLIMSNLVQQMYTIVDLMVIGKFAGSAGTVGVAVGGEIADLLTPVATALAGAGQVYIAQLAGAGEEKRIKETVGTLLTVMLTVSVFFIVITGLCYQPILRILNCPAEAYDRAVVYLLTTMIGFPFVFGYNAVCGVLRGLGESQKPLLFVCIAATVNVFLDILLVAVIPWGVFGTAIATVMSQIGACMAAFIYMYRRKEQFDFELRLSYFKIKKEPLRIILMLGIPKMAQSIFIRFSLLWCNSHINSYGLVASATNSIGNKLQKLCTVFVAAVDTGAGAMIGQNLGARKYDRVRQTVWTALACTLTFATVGSILALTVPEVLYGFFTNDAEVIQMGVVYMQIMVITLYLAACLGTFQAVITGCGFASFSFVIGMMDGVVCRIGFSILFVYGMDMGITGFFYGNAMARSIPAVICFLYFISGRWKTRKLLTER